MVLSAQCVLDCRNGDPELPKEIAIDSTGRVVLVLDSLLKTPADCPGDKKISVFYPGDKLLAEGFITAELDSFPFRGDTLLGKVLRVMIQDATTKLFCEGFIRPVDRIAPVILCVADTIGCNMDTSALALGYPEVKDNSGKIRRLEFVDELTKADCKAAHLARITRTWTAEDSSGNAARCEQLITIRRASAQEYAFPRDTILNCKEADTHPSRLGVPQLYGKPIRVEGYCQLTVGYKDDTTSQKNTADLKITRTWTIIDHCTEFKVIHQQQIAIQDKEAPQIKCPDDMVLRTLPNRCYVNVKLPRPLISDNCDPDPLMTVSTSFGGVGLGEHQFVPVGVHSVRYEVRDASGNKSFCTMKLTVVDEEAPTTICDVVTIASVPAQGYARVNASSFDNGSYDNCKPKVFYKARRTSQGECEQANGDDSPAAGYQEWFDDYVVFCCEEVGKNDLRVQMRVYELDPGPGPVDPKREEPGGDLFGHFTECLVGVEVQDKTGPIIECPSNRTVECTDDNLFNLPAFGSPLVAERCGFTLDSTLTKDLTNCGTGTLVRTWRAKDLYGNVTGCTQEIRVVNSLRLTADQIKWPKHYAVEQCGATLQPEDLPEEYNKPLVPDTSCLLIGFNYKDQVFDVSYPGCYEIMREWTVVDLCNYDPDHPELGGRYSYLQRIRVSDLKEPTLKAPRDTVVALTQNCQSVRVNLAPAVASDACSPLVVIKNDSPYADANGANASGIYPLGVTEINFTATDKCGNTTRARMVIRVVDKTPPAPICIVGLSLNLGQTDQGIAAVVNAAAFDGGTTDPCGSTIFRTIRRSGDSSPTPPSATTLTFTCKDLGPQAVQFWVADDKGNSTYCETFINIQDNNNLCGSSSPVAGSGGSTGTGTGTGGNTGSSSGDPNSEGGRIVVTGFVAGDILTEGGREVEEVMVKVNGGSSSYAMTGPDGFYEIPKLPVGGDYTILPEKNSDLMNGVSTLDLVLMSKHILGINRLSSPYRIIAADIDRSGSISTLDLIRLRKLILGQLNELPNRNTSWRFIQANYRFPNSANPFLETFPELYNVNDLEQDGMFANFVAVKVGDVNASAQANSLEGVEDRSTYGEWKLHVTDRPVRAGETAEVEVRAEDLGQIIGFQFTLDFDPEVLAFEDVEAGDLPGLTEENFGLQATGEGILTTSWNEMASTPPSGEQVLFRLRFRALANVTLGDGLRVSSRQTRAEAYDRAEKLRDVRLVFDQPAAVSTAPVVLRVDQNQPNPFRSNTIISFELGRAELTRLTIFDVSGQKLYQRESPLQAGYNEFEVYAADLPTSGILFYQIEAGGESATRKMILIG